MRPGNNKVPGHRETNVYQRDGWPRGLRDDGCNRCLCHLSFETPGDEVMLPAFASFCAGRRACRVAFFKLAVQLSSCCYWPKRVVEMVNRKKLFDACCDVARSNSAMCGGGRGGGRCIIIIFYSSHAQLPYVLIE